MKLRPHYVLMNEVDDGTGGNAGGTVVNESSNSGSDSEDDGSDGGEDGDDGSGKNNAAMAQLYAESKARKQKLDAAKKELTDKEQKIADLEKQINEFGADVDTVKKMLADKKKAEEQLLLDEKKYGELTQRMADEHQKAIDGLKNSTSEELTAKEKLLKKKDLQIESLLTGNAFSHSTYVQQDLLISGSAAQRLYGDFFEVEDGELVPYSAPSTSSKRVPLVDASGTPLSFDEALKEIVSKDPEKDAITKSKKKPGSRSKSTQTDGTPGEKKIGRGIDRIKFARNNSQK